MSTYPISPSRLVDDEPVPHARERVVAPEVDPEKRKPHHCELGEPVGPVDGVDEETARREDGALDLGLPERLQGALGLDDDIAVVDRLERATIGQPTGDLVGEHEAEPDGELEPEISPASGQSGAGATDHVGDSKAGAGGCAVRLARPR